MRLKRNFFNRKTLVVAKELLGKYLCRKIGSRIIRARIIETEAYCGQKDLASHASKGLTPRTKLMFGPPGYAYIYMIYGMYYCLNVVTEREGYPAAVLIRGVELVASDQWLVISKNNKSLSKKLVTSHYELITRLNGPGRLCRALRINRELNGIDLMISNDLWIEDSGEKISRSKIKRGKRIGVDYAGKWKDKLWRFYL